MHYACIDLKLFQNIKKIDLNLHLWCLLATSLVPLWSPIKVNIVKLHSKLGNPTELQLDGVGFDFVFSRHNNDNK